MSGPDTKLTLKIRTAGTLDEVGDLFAQLNALGFLVRSQDVTLVCGYYIEDDAMAARAAAEELLGEHPAVFKTKSTTALTTKRAIALPPPDEDDDDEEEPEEELPLIRAIEDAISAQPHFDDLPLDERIAHLLKLGPMSVAELVEALHNPESLVANPTEDDVQAVLDQFYEDDRATLELNTWRLTAPQSVEEAIEALRPAEGSGIEAVEITVNGRGTRLLADGTSEHIG